MVLCIYVVSANIKIIFETKKYFDKKLKLIWFDFHFSLHGMGDMIDFRRRKEKALAKLPKAQDSASDTLFSAEEINYIISGIESADRAEERRQKEIEARLKKLKESILRE